MTMQAALLRISGPANRRLYQGAGILTLLMILLMLGQLVYSTVVLSPEGGAETWFLLFNWNALLGFLSYELLMVLYALLSLPVLVACFVALREAPAALRWGFLLLGASSAIAFVASRPMWAMLELSHEYARATNEGEAAYLLAAGDELLRVFTGPTFQIGYYLASLSGLLLGIAMLRRPVFGRAAGWLRIASAVLDLGILLPAGGLFISILSVLVLLAFNIVMVRAFFRISRGGGSAGG